MKTTFTADDGKTFDNEVDCQQWERFQALLGKAFQESWDYENEENLFEDFVHDLIDPERHTCLLLESSNMLRLWEGREHIKKLAELMRNV